MRKALDRIKLEWEENPLAVIAVGTGAIYAVAKLLSSVASVNNSRSWSKEVNRRRTKAKRAS